MTRRLPFAMALLVLLGAMAPSDAPARNRSKSNPARKAAADKVAPAGPKSDSKGDRKEDKGKLNSGTLSGLKWRGIGPAFNSGRIIDLAIHPSDPNTWYVAVASGGVWKTTNHGVTFNPIFDDQGSYSIGCVTVDPNNPLVVWVGSGENNSQRSVSYGDGLYKSTNGGKNWEKAGLEKSEHIGMIRVDPRNSQVIYVAAQGPLWAAGGDRGLYKTTDGGKNWERILNVDDWTGVSEVHFDPRNPDVLYATSYQRGRRVWSLIDGGPGSAIWKSYDAGATWKKLENGIPKVDLGRIGLAVSPVNPDVVYAVIEAADGKQGIYRSTDAGGNWDKRCDWMSTSGQYYNELFADPKNEDRFYAVDTFLMVSDDGGRTMRRAGEKNKHVDNHVVWIDPTDVDHLVVGCDGGLYESWDRAGTWSFFANLPVTQFYKGEVDDDFPFYNVYGGTQDNNTLGGPTRTKNMNGILNADWFVVTGGDGFQPRCEPGNPDIVYGESQHGGLVRFDRKSGEEIDIQPQAEPGGEALRWNWDSPLIISPHSPQRLYFAAQRLYRSDNRGDSWTAVSPDLTRQIDRNTLKVMDKVWSIDAVAKNASTSFYGNIVSLSESPKVEGLLYVGCDDGLIQVSEDGGAHWRRVESVPGVPELTYVTYLRASQHSADRVYATFGNHKMGDFRPYVYRSDDRGRSWTPIAGDLPERGNVWAINEDPVKPELLFVGTEFGAFATVDGGQKWIQLKGGMPTIAVRDIAIQKRENDLVAITFGRGFYVLDDYTPLRAMSEAALQAGPVTFEVRPAVTYVPASPIGGRDKGSQGEGLFTSPNPPFGATLTYYLKDDLKTKKKQRQEREKDLVKEGAEIPYPTWDALKAEAREEDPYVLITILDSDGQPVRRMKGPASSGLSRVTWDLRWPSLRPVEAGGDEDPAPWAQLPRGPLAAPGRYRATFATVVDGASTPFGPPRDIEVRPLMNTTLPAADRPALAAFHAQSNRLMRAVQGTIRACGEAQRRIDALEKALLEAPGADASLLNSARGLEARLKDVMVRLTGDPIRGRYNEPRPPSISDRVEQVVGSAWSSTSATTGTHRDQYAIASREFSEVLGPLRQLIESDLPALEKQAEMAGAPWTTGRALPEWREE